MRSLGGSIYWRILMEKFCAFVENRTPEPLEILKIPTIYRNDPLLWARKRLGLHVDLKKSFVVGRKPWSPTTLTKVIIAREAAKGGKRKLRRKRKLPRENPNVWSEGRLKLLFLQVRRVRTCRSLMKFLARRGTSWTLLPLLL